MLLGFVFFVTEKNLSCNAAQVVAIKTGNNIKMHYQQSEAQLLPFTYTVQQARDASKYLYNSKEASRTCA